MALDFLQLLAADSQAFAAAVATGPADAPIAGCPGWTLHALGAHLGGVQRWAREAIITAAPPQIDPTADPVPDSLGGMAEWLTAGTQRLLATLEAAGPAAPTWHPFPVEPKVAGLWRRRQAQECSVHRYDAEAAIGIAATIEPEFAADGVDEYWHVMLPRMLTREQRTPPSTVLAVRLDGSDRRWTIDGAGGAVRVVGNDVDAAAEICGDALSLLLRLWGRPVDPEAIAISGDTSVADAWLALGGA
jgi:uncharacterized protein (TIGR03083 family)